MQINNKAIIPLQGQGLPQVQTPAQNPASTSFQQVMEGFASNAIKPLHFSKHANMRLDARQIQLSGEQMQRLENGVAKAQNKGIRDGLVLIDNLALVVNITNKVVVTALNQQDQVFTNIDGAVIV